MQYSTRRPGIRGLKSPDTPFQHVLHLAGLFRFMLTKDTVQKGPVCHNGIAVTSCVLSRRVYRGNGSTHPWLPQADL